MNRLWVGFALVFLCALSFGQEQSDALKYGSLIAEGDKAMMARDYEQAIVSFRSAMDIAPWDGQIYAQIARAEGRVGHIGHAVEAYKEAIRLGSVLAKHRANYEYQIALLYAKEEDEEECYKWLERSVNHGLRYIRLAQSRRFEFLADRDDYKKLAGIFDTDEMSREEGMLTDLRHLDREVRRVHFAPFGVTSKEELDREFAKLEHDIPLLTDEQFYVRMRQYMRLFGDGHTNLRLGNWTSLSDSDTYLPMTFYWFSEGIHVYGTLPKYEKLIGQKVVSLAGIPIDEIASRISTIVNQDNPQGTLYAVPILMNSSLILKGLGISIGADIELELKDPISGNISNHKFALEKTPPSKLSYAFNKGGAQVPLFIQHAQDKIYWYKVIPEQNAIYMQYNSVREDDTEPLKQFMAEVMSKIDEHDIHKLIIDVRFNGGGNSFLNADILQPVMRSEKINKEGHLFVITGRRTFSAAQNFTSDLMRDSEAIFVGEPTGSSPQFVGETIRSYLPYTKMQISISDLFWQRGWPMDHRIWIPPDLPAPQSVMDYLNNHDPALRAALDYQVKN